MQKTKVVIASILKPIDDTRMYEKFGLSLGQANKYDINIIGFASKNIPSHQLINFYSIGPFPRLSLKRFMAPFTVWKLYLKVKPKLIIFNTHEILIVTSLYKILFGAKIVYDIRENYAKNIRTQEVFPGLVRPALSFWVRFKEHLLKPFIRAQIVAERIYLTELPFLRKDAIVIENKYKNLPHLQGADERTNHQPHKLLYSGTIATQFGIFEAISVVKALHKINSNIRFTIIGYCAQKQDLIRLKEAIADCDYIELKGGDHLVPHSEIVDEIRNSDVGLIMNRPSRASDAKLPTRLFEYTANRLPVLCINNPNWIEFLDQFNAGIPIDPESFEASTILHQLSSTSFYDKGDVRQSLWTSEEPKLLELVEDALS